MSALLYGLFIYIQQFIQAQKLLWLTLAFIFIS